MKKFRMTAAAFACAALTACAGTEPARYSGLPTDARLHPNSGDDADHVAYTFGHFSDWSKYSSIIVDPVEIYHGADGQFGDMSEKDRQALARYAETKFRKVLSSRFSVDSDYGASALRVKLVLTGADTSTPVLSTFAHLDMGGSLYNGVQAARGKEGMMTGWVIYVVEVRDASSGTLLLSYEAKEYPSAFNVFATFGSLSAAKVGVDKAAQRLLKHLK